MYLIIVFNNRLKYIYIYIYIYSLNNAYMTITKKSLFEIGTSYSFKLLIKNKFYFLLD